MEWLKPNELRELVNQLVLNQTDTAKLTEGLEKIVKVYEEKYTTGETLSTELDANKERISELQRVNMDFFLKLHQQEPLVKEEDKPVEKTIEEIALELGL